MMSDLETKVLELERRVRELEHPTEIRLQSDYTEVVIRASGVVIYAAGKVAAALTAQAAGPVLTLFASSGQPAVGIDVTDNCAALRLFDSHGKPKAEIQVVDGVPEFYLLGNTGNRLIELDSVSGANLLLNDPSGQARVQLSVSESGAVVTRLK